HDTKKIPAMFPFGHGLSYTTFEYDKASLSSNLMEGDKSITVSVPVTNIGKVAGKEVVQLYIADEKSSLPRPLKELKGFKKVELNPSQTEVVKFEITPDDLKFFDDKAHEWIAEPGKFKVYIGSSSTDIKSTLQFSYK
ncbi:fibronectin type III-like domain-contianing protein, partial [uncultured Muribaculum sp.]